MSELHDPVYTVGELSRSDWFPFKDSTIRKLIKSKRLKALNVSMGAGKPIYKITKESVDTFLKSLEGGI